MGKKIIALSSEVRLSGVNGQDYVSRTDIARYKNADASDDLIRNWLRNRNTLEFASRISVEFKLNMALFGPTAAQWRAANPDDKGNVRDHATGAQLVCLSNLEKLNALFISEGLPQTQRLTKLNQIAIEQMKLLTVDDRLPKLPDGKKGK